MNLYDQAGDRSRMLKERTKRCVCKFCGEKLSLKLIDFGDFDDAHIESFCDHCNRIEFGVEPEIYTSAKYYVEEFDINIYPDMGDTPLVKKMNIKNICNIISWGLQHLGYVDKKGFLVPPSMDSTLLGECIVLNDELLSAATKESSS